MAEFPVKNNPDSASRKEYWEGIFASRRWGLYPAEDLVRFMGRAFRAEADKARIRVLDVGCGPGSNLWYLVREGFTTAGIDGSPTAIRQAQERLMAERLAYTAPRVDLRVGNFSTLPWPDSSFDAVVDIASLYANPMKTIKATTNEIHRVLKPGGIFFGRMFGTATTGSDSGDLVEPGTRSNPTAGPCAGNAIAHFFSRPELEELFARFQELGIDETRRTDRNGEIQIFEWLVSAHR